MGRRDANDPRWKEAKAEVQARDKGDRMLKVLSALEVAIMRKNAGPRAQTLDPAHINPVSDKIEWCYDPNNIILINRFSHEMLDSCRDPVTGKFIGKNEREQWWIRIIKGNKKQYEYLREHDMLPYIEEE